MLARNTKLTFLLCIGNTIIMHLERTNHTAHIMGMNNSSRFWVALGKQGMQLFLANTLGKLLIAHTTIVLKFTRGKVHLIEGGLEIQPRTSAKNRQATRTKETFNMRASVLARKNCMPCLPSAIQNRLLLFIPITCAV